MTQGYKYQNDDKEENTQQDKNSLSGIRSRGEKNNIKTGITMIFRINILTNCMVRSAEITYEIIFLKTLRKS